MIQTRRHLLATGAATLAVTACAGLPGGDAAPAGGSAVEADIAPNEALAAFFERQFERVLDRSPMLAASLGDPRGMSSLGDPSRAFAREGLAQTREAVAEMRRLVAGVALNHQDALSVRLYETSLERAEAGARFDGHSYPFNQMFGAHSAIPTFMANQHRVTSVADAEAYIARLQGVRAYLRAIVADSDASAARGITPPRFVYDYVISDCRNLLAGAPMGDGPAATPIWADIQTKVDRLDIAPAEKDRLKAAARAALVESVKPAYEDLVRAMQAQQAAARTTDGVWALPEGEAYYAERLANQTTTALTAAQIHQIGLDAVARIHGEMRQIMARVGFTGDLHAFFDDLETNPRFFVADTPEGKAEYMRIATAYIDTMRTRLPEAFNLMPRAPMEVRAVEAFREASAGLAFYQRPSADGSRPGIYYVNTSNVRAIPLYQAEALAYHEGIPGHHMQIAIMQELPGLPRFRRFGGGFTAYSEGWALYTELLPKEMGFYQDPYSDFGRLVLELRRAIRLVVDTGLHALRWPRQQAIDYILANQPGDEASARRDIDRYIVMPGQATAYLIGQIEILRLRERARAHMGAAFDIRGFHDVVLANGSVPLNVLAELVDRWSGA